MKTRMLGRQVAAVALTAALSAALSAGGAQAQDAALAALEARIAQLEGELGVLRSEVEAARAASAPATPGTEPRPVIQLEARPAASAPEPAADAPRNGFRMGDHLITMGGFIKADMMVSDYDGGDPANGDLLRDFYLPGAIPIGGAGEGLATDFNARQTRLWLASAATVGGRRIGGRIEMDFQVLPGSGDQRTTSPANLSLRRAYVTLDNWLIGQEWTNFQNVSVLPETADYVGVSEGTAFARQAQVRYTRGGFSIALENPETTVSPFGGGARITADDNSLPDLTARYAWRGGWGEASIAGLARQLRYEAPALGLDAEAFGWGVSAAARIRLGEGDDLRLMLTGGEGIGRYVGLNFSNDAVLDASGELQPIGVVAGFAAWRHQWRPGWRSSLIWSFQDVDNDTGLTGLGVNRSARSLRANLIWTAAPGVDVGAELMQGRRELESSASGEMTRLQAFVRYGF